MYLRTLQNHTSLKVMNIESQLRNISMVVCFLLGNYQASDVYMPTFRNILFHLHRQVDVSRMN